MVERYDLTSIILMNITAINSTTTEYIVLYGGYVRSWSTNNYPEEKKMKIEIELENALKRAQIKLVNKNRYEWVRWRLTTNDCGMS